MDMKTKGEEQWYTTHTHKINSSMKLLHIFIAFSNLMQTHFALTQEKQAHLCRLSIEIT